MRAVAIVSLVVGVLLLAPASSIVRSQALVPGFGIMGDSNSDEYRADDGRGGSYGATTLNWMELLAKYRGVNFGTWGTRDYPRRTGYANNWALSGARAADVVAGGQAQGLAAQVASGEVQIALLMVGFNDFAAWNGTYQEVYDGTISGDALTAKDDAIVSNIASAIDIVIAAGPVALFVAPIAADDDPAAFPDAAKRQIVKDAVAAVNAGIEQVVASRGVHFLDTAAEQQEVLARIDPVTGNLMVGGEAISITTKGDEPHHAQLSDNHSGTVLSGLIANVISDSFNTVGAGIDAFTDDEIIRNAGIIHDVTAPTLTLTSPLEGATITGSTTVTANATDDVGVVGVTFYVDGTALGSEDTAAPYSRSWSSPTPGPHVVSATARDAAGHTTSASAHVTVVDTTPPTVSISSPKGGAVLVGAVTISASASDNVGVAGVTFYAGGSVIGDDTAAPFSVSLNTTAIPNGSLALTAVARDAAGNTRTSSTINVTVNNPAPDTTAPSVNLTSPADGATIWGTVTVAATATDNVKVVGVRFKVDNTTIGSEDTVAPFSVSWNTASTLGTHTLTATARDAAGNTTTSTINVTVVPATTDLFPSNAAVTLGSALSGSLPSFTADDNNYFVIGSAASGFTARTSTELSLAGSSGSASSFTVNVVVKSSRDSTSLTIEAYNFGTGAWQQLSSTTAGTSETTKSITVNSGVAGYRGASNEMRLRISSSRVGSSYSLSLDRVRVTVAR